MTQSGKKSEWNGEPLEVVREFQYSGILFHQSGVMGRAAVRMQGPFAKVMAKVRTLVKREELADLPPVTLWLFQVMALHASLWV
jgi:hypothetical protein